ncbi:protein of unknown function [uncultured Sphingopyxis sp.]|uniref:Uncharacterized protein n=1 Tax=uncultured Sphingopyxis sp. TaxID=310581 RepID=A0A1Y5PX67_9SPHN|nr:protein of unknown function [uncultured Sphingopyxis sp.]
MTPSVVGKPQPCARSENMKIGAAKWAGKPPFFSLLALSPLKRHRFGSYKKDVQTIA